MQFPRRRRGDEREPVIPLINIIFLLLIFFLVTGTLRSAELFDIEPPRAAFGAPGETESERVLLGLDGRLAFAGTAVDLATLEVRAGEYVREQRDRHLVVKADGRVRAERVIEVMDALRRAGVREISLVTEWQPEP